MSGARPLAALTGASGFIGRHLVATLGAAGWRTRLLLRREVAAPEWREVETERVAGSLADPAALDRLVDGADAVIHVAGLIKAARREAFFAVNRDGAAAVAAAAARRAPQAPFLLVSSLAAREPDLSDYAASKRAGEDAVREATSGKAMVVRPPAVYGPGDRETLVFFRLASLPRVPLLGSAEARAALIHVDDLCRLLVAAVASPLPPDLPLTASDDRPLGYGWDEVLGAAARAVGRAAPRFWRVPPALLGGVAAIGDVGRAFGAAGMINRQKLREIRHPDWAVAAGERALPAGWKPRFDLDAGFVDAVRWYRAAGWLRPA